MLRRCGSRLVLPSASYEQFVKSGLVEDDTHQRAALTSCDRLYADLANLYAAARQPDGPSLHRDLTPRPKEHMGLIPMSVLIKREQKRVDRAQGIVPELHPLSAVKGLYIHGGTGTGKTALTDILYHEVPVTRKKRVHFRQFIHEARAIADRAFKIHKWKKEDSEQLVNELAVKLCTNAELMVFDDVAIYDEDEADLLRRAFTGMYQVGICAVFAAHAPPKGLFSKTFRGRKMMAPFIALVERHCEIIDLGNHVDYRLTSSDTLRGSKPYLCASADLSAQDAQSRFDSAFLLLCSAMAPQPTVIRAYGRDIEVPKAVGGVCRFSFNEILEACPGDNDFKLIAKRFHTVFIDGLPQFDAVQSAEDAERLVRFTKLIDALHSLGTKTVIRADVPMTQLVAPVAALEGRDEPKPMLLEGATVDADSSRAPALAAPNSLDLLPESTALAVRTCESQLAVMQSIDYLRTPHKGRGEVSLLDGAPDLTDEQLDAMANEAQNAMIAQEAAFNAMARVSETSWPLVDAKSEKRSGNPYKNWKHPISRYMRTDESLYEQS